ncbi:DNA mismatch repair endonuclease MutL [Elioraea sp. Yellowstone]|jgi:DNA mismatch repair protein MutL|uniref:DNA mismatch repair endonuclease MutL n=1 Tax=Elioraea sp. Yellowstone TaxID=2592070 RepID=UPI0011508CBA|nr:DNA mismatch repair endonuclease MutL [Elioraea sp. Yellowstone]TQF82526.1 DNA mismatch repair endonuclease MutL [Elioraea sp. Yellowstone]
MTIRLLPPAVADRIAAGEVVERPASVVKELVENALDAGARRIAVAIEGGGTARVTVEDDGAGIAPHELALAVERHATSKLADERLIEIATLGFRGEALPSIGAVARLEIVSRAVGSDTGARIAVEAGAKGEVRPAAAPPGTRVTVRDLFFATPARLKFLKTARTEAEACVQAVRRLALAHPAVGFTVTLDGREALAAPPAERSRRIAGLIPDLAEHAIEVASERGAVALAGVISPPSLTRATATEQHLMVNGRPVADRLLRTALRVAYGDLIAQGRHPLAVLALTLPAEAVDVNVHPAKAEVRFREPDAVRGFVISALRSALGTARSVAPAPAVRWPPPMHLAAGATALAEAPALPLAAPPLARPVPVAPPQPEHPLGAARAQLLDTYIVAETADGAVVLVDQHAAAERLAHEALKRALEAGGGTSQTLLSPEVVELSPAAVEAVLARADDLARLGLAVEPFGGAVLVRAVPAPLAGCDAAALLRDIAEELAESGETTLLRVRIDAVLARMACHGSLRAGRRLTPAEMDALLRRIETTPNSGTCSHGRPTWIRLTRGELERLFGRR